MNRQQQRAMAATKRTAPTVSPRLLQKQVATLQQEGQQMRHALFAIIKEQGRIRVLKATIDGLNDGDGLEARDLGDAILFEYKPSGMMVPSGVKDGQVQPKESA